MKRANTFIIYLLLWVGAFAMMLFNAFNGNHTGFHQWAIATAICLGLMIGEARGRTPTEKLLDQLASISLFLFIAILIAFSDWALWFVPAIICALAFMFFALWLWSYSKHDDAGDRASDATGSCSYKMEGDET